MIADTKNTPPPGDDDTARAVLICLGALVAVLFGINTMLGLIVPH